MSELVQPAEHAAEAASPQAALAVEAPFTEEQIEQFDADDTVAGRSIGKMLAMFFLYTVIVMLIVAWWTFTRHN